MGRGRQSKANKRMGVNNVRVHESEMKFLPLGLECPVHVALFGDLVTLSLDWKQIQGKQGEGQDCQGSKFKHQIYAFQEYQEQLSVSNPSPNLKDAHFIEDMVRNMSNLAQSCGQFTAPLVLPMFKICNLVQDPILEDVENPSYAWIYWAFLVNVRRIRCYRRGRHARCHCGVSTFRDIRYSEFEAGYQSTQAAFFPPKLSPLQRKEQIMRFSLTSRVPGGGAPDTAETGEKLELYRKRARYCDRPVHPRNHKDRPHLHNCANPGCDAQESRSGLFRVCDQCRRLRIRVRLFFCSQKCHQEFWPIHKFYHSLVINWDLDDAEIYEDELEEEDEEDEDGDEDEDEDENEDEDKNKDEDEDKDKDEDEDQQVHRNEAEDDIVEGEDAKQDGCQDEGVSANDENVAEKGECTGSGEEERGYAGKEMGEPASVDQDQLGEKEDRA